MKPLGGHSGAYVVDLANGEVLFDDRGSVARNPASVEKLYTLTTVLARFGLDGTLQTSVYARRHARLPTGCSAATSTCAAAATRRSAMRRSSSSTTAAERASRRSRKLLVADVHAAQDQGARSSATSPTSTACAAARRPTTQSTRTSSARSARSPSIAARRGADGLAGGLCRVPPRRRSARTAASSSPAARTPASMNPADAPPAGEHRLAADERRSSRSPHGRPTTSSPRCC